MPTVRTCSSCGAQLAGDDTGTVCRECVIRLGRERGKEQSQLNDAEWEQMGLGQLRRLATTEERQAFLAMACGEDEQLRERLEAELTGSPRIESLDTPTESRGLKVRCPNCRAPVIVVPDKGLSGISCTSCHSRFSLIGEESETRNASIAHFELIERLGMGGFGCVWKARDTVLDRLVALKIPHRRSQRDDAVAFLREAQAAAQLSHPYIVPVHEIGSWENRPYIVSDFIPGVSLDEWIAHHRPSPRQSAELVQKIADAIQHAHHRGVIHRDLKPQNILMDLRGEPHITDFGIARRDALLSVNHSSNNPLPNPIFTGGWRRGTANT